MGLLVDGKWVDQWYETEKSGGKFVRKESQFRNWIKADEGAEFKAEAGRYHLYVSHACPWAHRTLIFRKLKQLENIISFSWVHPHMLDKGWSFQQDTWGASDPLYNCTHAYEIYLKAQSDYSGRVTVPILWDKKKQTIVNNESSEIIRMFNSEFNALTGNKDDYYPENLRQEIDQINDFIYSSINNGVYKCGFATTQGAYEEACIALFKALDRIEEILKTQAYLVGDQITEADWRLFTTLIRFDPVYYSHFKTNIRQLRDYPAISAYIKKLREIPGIKETVKMDHIKAHYFYSHDTINPTRIVPLGPKIDF